MMAKKASAKTGRKTGRTSGSRSVARVSASRGGGGSRKQSGFDASDAFIKLLQSPLVAELVAVAATAALASLAEHGFTSTDASRRKRAGRAVKEAGKAAAAAVGRRLSNELDEIKKAAKTAAKG
jgi:hypothetical protein